MSNDEIITVAKDITIAMFTNQTTLSPTQTTGKVVADFMQVVYDKIVELNNNDQ